MSKTKKLTYFGTVMCLLLIPVFVLAALPTVTVQPGDGGVDLREIEDIIRTVANFLMIVAVIIAVIYIIWGGITYMAAGADETKASSAKTRIKNGVIGAAVVLGVGVILQTLAGIISRSFFQ
jgi:hypothetical protein